MFDTHAHVHGESFDADREATLARAAAAGVTRIQTIGCDLADSALALEIAARYGLDASIGIHPHEAKDAPADVAAAFDALRAGAAVAPQPSARRVSTITTITALATSSAGCWSPTGVRPRRRLPLIFHQRDAFDDFLAVLRGEFAAPMRGVVHCFTGDAAQARLLVDEFGLKLGIGGVVTFKTAEGLREAVREVGLDHIVLETDCPYLAPVPYRGKRNEPAFVAATAARVAEVLETSLDEVVKRSTDTAVALFGV